MSKDEKTPEIPPEMAKSMRERLRLVENMSKIKRKIAVMSGKGGVGKSTVAANLACVLARDAKVGLLDADITGPDVPKLMGVEDASPQIINNMIDPIRGLLGIKIISMGHIMRDKDTPVIWRGPLKMVALRQFLMDVDWGELDYLVIDLPPGTSDEPLSIAQDIGDSGGSVIVTTPQELSLLDVQRSINFSTAVRLPVLGIVENMSGYTCPKCGHHEPLFKTGGGKSAADEYGVPFLGSIPIDPDIVIGGDSGKPFVVEHPESMATKAFESTVENIRKEVEKIKAKPKFKPVGT